MNKWKFLANGTWAHPTLGRVYLNEDTGRTFRATTNPNGGWRDELKSPGGRATRFRSVEAAIAALEKAAKS